MSVPFEMGMKAIKVVDYSDYRQIPQLIGSFKIFRIAYRWYEAEGTLLDARFLKVCRYDQLRRNSCYDELGCNSLVVIALLLRPA